MEYDEIIAELRRNNADPEEQSYGSEVLSNVIPSGKAAINDFISTFQDPIGAAKNAYDLGVGVYSLLTDGDEPEEEMARAVGQYYADRYGSLDAVKNSFKTDPVGVALDFASAFSGMGGAVRGTASLASTGARKVGADDVAVAIDKVRNSTLGEAARAALITSDVASGKAVGQLGSSLPPQIGKRTSNALGQISGAGAENLQRSFEMGRSSLPFGQRARQFKQTMREQGPLSVSDEQFADMASTALGGMRKDASAEYRSGLSAVDFGAPDPNLFNDVLNTVTKFNQERRRFAGPDSKADTQTPANAPIVDSMIQDVYDFSSGPMQNREALYALRVKLDEYEIQPKTTADRLRSQLRDELQAKLKEDKKYAEVMSNYERANKIANEIESELSLGRRNNVSQKLRKLNSITRNNVNTNFGRRVELVERLGTESGQNLVDVATGMALRADEPTGAARIAQSTGQNVGLLSVMADAVEPSQAVSSALAQSFFTPRTMGEVSMATGRAAMAARPATSAFSATAPTAGLLGYALERTDVPAVEGDTEEEYRRRLLMQGLLVQ